MTDSRNDRPVGRVAGLWRYPIKSMGGEALASVDVSWHGLSGDRRWAFVRHEVQRSGFPWLTIRERHDMNRYQPSFADPAKPDRSPVIVKTPTGATCDCADPLLAAELYPDGTHIIKQDRGIFDTFPLSLISTRTIAWLSATAAIPLAVERFRPNILVEAVDDSGFPEDGWLGCILQIGTLRLRVDERDGRCSVITIDPVTSTSDPSILRRLAGDRQGCAGVYGTTVRPGHVALGDSVYVESGFVEPELTGSGGRSG